MKSCVIVLAFLGVGVLSGCSAGADETGVDEGAAAAAARCIGGPVVYDAAGNIIAQARCMGDSTLAKPHAYIQTKVAKDDKPFFLVRVHDAGVERDAKDDAVLVSEMYETRAARESGMRSFSTAIRKGGYEVKTAQDQSAYFVVKASNGKVLATSGTYGTKAAAEKGLESLKKAFKESDTTIEQFDGDNRSGWYKELGRPGFVLKAGNNKVVLTAQTEEDAFTAHDLGAADRVALLARNLIQRGEVCESAAGGSTGQFFPVTENLAIETVVLSNSAQGGVEKTVFLPAIIGGPGGTVAPMPIAEGNQFDTCQSALESLDRVVRILDSIPRG